MPRPINPHVRAVLRALKAAGDPVVKIDDGGALLVATPTEGKALAVIAEVDACTLLTKAGEWVYLTPYEREKEDVVADYSLPLEPILDKL